MEIFSTQDCAFLDENFSTKRICLRHFPDSPISAHFILSHDANVTGLCHGGVFVPRTAQQQQSRQLLVVVVVTSD